MPGKINSQSRQISFCYDESLPPAIGVALKSVGFPIDLASKGTLDEDLIPEMGQRNQVWITKDDRSKTQHERLLQTAKISVVWVRGLTHERRKRKASIQRNAGLKDILRMLVNKLDQIEAEVADAKGPRYFLLYTTTSQRNQDKYEAFTNLRKVRDRLAGVSER